MSAMEKMALSMLSNVFGVTPEKMQETMQTSMKMLVEISQRFEAIENRLIAIENKLDIVSENYTHEPVTTEQAKYLEANSHVNGNA